MMGKYYILQISFNWIAGNYHRRYQKVNETLFYALFILKNIKILYIHEYTKPLREVEDELRSEGKRIYQDAMNGEECASMFAQLEGKNPNIKLLIDRLQYATGNDRFYTMMNELTSLGVQPPCRFYRSLIKTDDTSYIFDNGTLPLRNGFSR